jgi:hypothetical protein
VAKLGTFVRRLCWPSSANITMEEVGMDEFSSDLRLRMGHLYVAISTTGIRFGEMFVLGPLEDRVE